MGGGGSSMAGAGRDGGGGRTPSMQDRTRGSAAPSRPVVGNGRGLCRPAAAPLSDAAGRGGAGRLPSALVLGRELLCAGPQDRSGMGDTGRGSAGGRGAPSRGGAVGECGFVFRGSRGRLLAAADAATNFLGAVAGFFLDDDVRGISSPVLAVLPDEGKSESLSAESAESCGETTRAVGLGPDDGTRAFFRIGCGAAGRDEGRLLSRASLGVAAGGGKPPSGGRAPRSRARWASTSCLVMGGAWPRGSATRLAGSAGGEGAGGGRTSGPSHRLGGPWSGAMVGPREMSS